jgi:cytochrome c-type biogenesis protein CcmH/NrfF
MKFRILPAVLLFVLVGVCLPQTASQLVTPEIRRVGEKLACKCGHCNNTIASCQMIGCGYATPARERIAALQKQGASDQSIVDGFVKEMGIVALAVPPAEGFHLLGWVMPFVVIAVGLCAIFIYWKRFRKPAAAVAGASAATPEPEIDEKYRKRIEAEMADLD